jgi:hypothetical protein
MNLQEMQKAVYQNKINKFIFASSDSDIWALISSLPDAEILILAETSKCSDILTEALTQKSIQTIFLEDIADDSGELRDRLMYQTMAEGMSQFYIDIRRIAFASAQKLNLYLDREVIEKYAEEMMHDIHISKDEENKRIYASIK